MMLCQPGARLLVSAVLVITAAGCGPKIAPLTGVVAESSDLRSYDLPRGSSQKVITWELQEGPMFLRGEGLVRVSYPDTARVDLQVSGGFGGGVSVILIGDRAVFPPGAMMTHLLPSPPLLWAALGRLSPIAASDTTVRIQGDTLRADLGNPVQWRVNAVNNRLTMLERVSDGRIAEITSLTESGTVIYENPRKRKLVIRIHNTTQVDSFEPRVWRYDE